MSDEADITLPNGIVEIHKGSRDWYDPITMNWRAIDALIERMSESETKIEAYKTVLDERINNIPEPIVPNNGSLRIRVNDSEVVFSADQSDNTVLDIVIPQNISDLNNDSNFATKEDITRIEKHTVSYNDLSDRPDINNGKLTLVVNDIEQSTFTANQSGDSEFDITIPEKVSELENDSDYTPRDELKEVAFTNDYNDLDNTPEYASESDIDVLFEDVTGLEYDGIEYADNSDIDTLFEDTIGLEYDGIDHVSNSDIDTLFEELQ